MASKKRKKRYDGCSFKKKPTAFSNQGQSKASSMAYKDHIDGA